MPSNTVEITLNNLKQEIGLDAVPIVVKSLN
jgi:hypothetical protein